MYDQDRPGAVDATGEVTSRAAEGPPSHDRVIEAIGEVESAAATRHEAIDSVAAELSRARGLLLEGRTVSAVVEHLVSAGGRDLRLRPAQAAAEYERAMTVYRAVAIRELVDVEGHSYSQIASMTGVSRQMVARLYRGASRSDEAGETT